MDLRRAPKLQEEDCVSGVRPARRPGVSIRALDGSTVKEWEDLVAQ